MLIGNSCFSFLIPVYGTDLPLDSRKTNNKILLDALSSFDVRAELSGRNDITIDGKKISGSAYQVNLGKSDGSNKKALHHGLCSSMSTLVP
jgi:lipoate-protein ligase A